MAKTDKLYKVLRIVLVTLAIMGCVFGLMKKVGLCADSSQISVPTEQPFIPMFQYSPLANNPEAQRNLTDDLFEFFGSSDFVLMFDNVNDVTSIKIYARTSGPFGIYAFSSWLGGSGQTINYVGTPYSGHINADGTLNGSLNVSPYGNGFYYETAGNVNNIVITIGAVNPYIPVFSARTVYDVNDMGNEGVTACLTAGVFDEGSGDDVIDFDYIQSLFDNTSEFSSDMADLISDLPTDDGTTTTGQWFSNLFSLVGGGFSGLFANIYRFFKPYLDNFHDFWVTIIDLFNDIKDNGLSVLLPTSITSMFTQFYNLGLSNNEFTVSTFLHNLIFCSPSRLNSIWTTSQTGQAVNSLKGCLTSVVNCYSATPSEHVYWRFDFSNTSLFSNVGVITINFDWYNSIRTPVITLFSVFFILGFLFLWIRKIPGIISGASSNSDDK